MTVGLMNVDAYVGSVVQASIQSGINCQGWWINRIDPVFQVLGFIYCYYIHINGNMFIFCFVKLLMGYKNDL